MLVYKDNSIIHPKIYISPSIPLQKNTMEFTNKVVVVTGGGSGLGLQIATDLHLEDAIVHILGRKEAKLKAAQETIAGEDHSRFFYHVCDISDEAQVQEAFQRIKEVSGAVYGLVNSAGVSAVNPLLDTQSRHLQKALKILLRQSRLQLQDP